MRRAQAVAMVMLMAGAVPAAGATNERTVPGWPMMSLTFAGNGVAYAKSTSAYVPQGRYTIHRTDTYRLPLVGTRFTGRQIDGMVLRTSAGRTTAGPMAGDGTARYVIAATGRNFPPQVVFCCRPDGRDLPVEASGRLDGPTTRAVTLDGKVVRYVLGDPDGSARLVTFHVGERPGEPFALRVSTPLGDDINLALVAMAPGIVAWVDRSAGSVHLATTTARDFGATPGPVIPQDGQVVRIHVSRSTVVTLLRRPDGYRLVRYDGPAWAPRQIWRGTRPPGPTALGDRTVAIVDGGVVQQQVPGARRRGILRLRGAGTAVATDGRRIAVIERRRVRVGRRVVRRSVIVVVAVRTPPGAYLATGVAR